MSDKLVLWRIEGPDGKGPYYSSARSIPREVFPENGWTSTARPTPQREGVEMKREHRCAFANLRQLVKWFPGSARRDLEPYGLRLCRLEVPREHVTVTTTQAVYHGDMAEVVAMVPLQRPVRRIAR